jgi:hypothetical protein
MLTDEDRQWLVSQIAATEQRTMARLEATEARLESRIERTETALLAEFHKWASPVEMRQRTHAAALRAVDTEMEALSDRVKKLEAS